jgi:hypothetical protein
MRKPKRKNSLNYYVLYHFLKNFQYFFPKIMLWMMPKMNVFIVLKDHFLLQQNTGNLLIIIKEGY